MGRFIAKVPPATRIQRAQLRAVTHEHLGQSAVMTVVLLEQRLALVERDATIGHGVGSTPTSRAKVRIASGSWVSTT